MKFLGFAIQSYGHAVPNHGTGLNFFTKLSKETDECISQQAFFSMLKKQSAK
jgi:hypothetical protein